MRTSWKRPGACALVLALVWLLALAGKTVRAQEIVYVNAAAALGGDGRAWGSAFQNLQDALARAAAVGQAGTEIWVAAGTYAASTRDDRSDSFELRNGTALYGGFAGNETSREERDPLARRSVLTGEIGRREIRDDNSLHVVTGMGVGASTVLDGFMITQGMANAGIGNETRGGGLLLLGALPTVRRCTFIENSADGDGGAVYMDQGSAPTFVNCDFRGNSALSGAAIYALDSSPELINCTFVGNQALVFGGAMCSFSSQARLVNCTLFGNTAFTDGGGLFVYLGEAQVQNSILWANENTQITAQASEPTVSFSCVQGGWPGTRNTDVDPRLVNASTGIDVAAGEADLRLVPGSPCIDAGTNAALPPDVTTDMAGDARRQDDPDVLDTGDGEPPLVDIGAFEAPGVGGEVDSDGDGVPDADEPGTDDSGGGTNPPRPRPRSGGCGAAGMINMLCVVAGFCALRRARGGS